MNFNYKIINLIIILQKENYLSIVLMKMIHLNNFFWISKIDLSKWIYLRSRTYIHECIYNTI